MKINRTYSIDSEIIEKLKGINASELISKLLTEYFDKKDNFINKMSKEELALFIKLEKEKKEIEKKLTEVQDGSN
jgi:tryptophanyl-tRNA synthetase